MKIPTSAAIVGARFRPPAADVLNCLPSGCTLVAQREPSNPHDPNAIMVLCEESALHEALALLDLSADTIELHEAGYHLGYIPRDQAEWMAEHFDAVGGQITGGLTFSAEGKPQIELELEQDGPEESLSVDAEGSQPSD